MHLYKTVKNFLFDQDYFIDIWSNYLHVYEFIDILTLNEKEINLQLEKFKLLVKGDDFRVLKLTKNEILVSGNIIEKRFISWIIYGLKLN